MDSENTFWRAVVLSHNTVDCRLIPTSPPPSTHALVLFMRLRMTRVLMIP